MAHDVFISYSTKNAAVADTVCAGLERRGIRCWIAPRDIEPGEDWPSAIITAIETCNVFVIIVSSASNLSDDVLHELQNAASNGIPIIPFRIEDVKLSPGMRYYLGTPQWFDALTKPLGQHVVRLADTVSGLLGRAVRQDDAPAVVTTDVPVEQGRPRRPNAAAFGRSLPTMLRSAIVAALALLVMVGAYVAIRSAGEARTGAVPEFASEAVTATDITASPDSDPTETQEPSTGSATVTLPQPVPQDKPWEKAGTEVGEEIVGPDGGVYVWVPPGSFMMGSDDGEAGEKPIHRVEMGGFWLGKYEVTNAQYRAFCHATGREFPADSDQAQNHPVVRVSWDDARLCCDHYGLGLPTEAQWEYAAAGPNSNKWPWGNECDDAKLCWYHNQGPDGQTFPVGSFAEGASWCGTLDMAGNVWEWCADWYGGDYYRRSPQHNPLGPDAGLARVLRGGSWIDYNEYDFRCARRLNDHPDYRSNNLGFRCARTVP